MLFKLIKLFGKVAPSAMVSLALVPLPVIGAAVGRSLVISRLMRIATLTRWCLLVRLI